ncbi:LamG domain-containing protein [Paenibacillus assamensis]|uniref:LamG domain-containing protein n=1 Tax=Paenibacillus assamensis TaxID=311244 RepID=UPI0003FC2689|nr:LamG domain-containing protein [Paenibacillus assamensis]
MKKKLVFKAIMITLLSSMLFTSSAFANTSVHYEYDAKGNLIRTTQIKLTDLSNAPAEKMTFAGDKKVSIVANSLNQAENGRTTVQFWMNWSGQSQQMPFSWGSGYDLYITSDVLGFNTFNGEVYGFNAVNLKNKWVHVTAVFNNGDITKSELYINGERQTLKKYGANSFVKHVSTNATIGGWWENNAYNFKGQLADFKIWNRALTPAEIASSVTKQEPVASNDLIGRWKLNEAPDNALKLKGKQRIELSDISTNTQPGAKTTVQFWMKWDGINAQMPFSWGGGAWEESYTLYLAENRFGFNTGVADMYGISSLNMTNRWSHVTAVFSNGNVLDNELYIDGVKQTLVKSGNEAQSRNVGGKAIVSGWGYDHNYKFNGQIAELKIWNRALSAEEAKSEMYKAVTNDNNGLVYSMFE